MSQVYCLIKIAEAVLWNFTCYFANYVSQLIFFLRLAISAVLHKSFY